MGRVLESLKRVGRNIKELASKFVEPQSEIELSLADGENVDLSKLDISPEMRQAFEDSERTMGSFVEKLDYVPEEHKKTFKAKTDGTQITQPVERTTKLPQQDQGIER